MIEPNKDVISRRASASSEWSNPILPTSTEYIPILPTRRVPLLGTVEEDGLVVTFSGKPLPKQESKADALKKEARKRARGAGQ